MRRILLYYLALIIVIIEAAMFVSVILVPLALWLREELDWFENPFDTAGIVDDDIGWRKVKRDLEKAEREKEQKRRQ